MYYVYMLIDPRTTLPFYVGKGTGKRALQHLWEISRERNYHKRAKIKAIREAGMEPEIVYFQKDIIDPSDAYDIEASLIRKFGRKGYDPGGILTNVMSDARSPSQKGRSYIEIYGVEGAKQQIAHRRMLQLQRGGYGPKTHSIETRAKLKAATAARPIGLYPHSDSTKQKIRDALSGCHTGQQNVLSNCYQLSHVDGRIKRLYGGELKTFCVENGLSLATFKMNIAAGWPPSQRGKNVGWTIRLETIGPISIVAADERLARPIRVWQITFPDGQQETHHGAMKHLCQKFGLSYDLIRHSKGAFIQKGVSKGFRFTETTGITSC